MDNLEINVGIKRLMINDDPDNVIEFNPSDLLFAEKFYALMKDFEVKRLEYQKRAEVIDANKELDEMGLPKNIPDNLALLRDACQYMRGKIDELMGAGTSQKAFGIALNLDMFSQFFNGIMPYIQTARAEKVKKYAPRKRHKAVMQQ
jgi:hypothetical protein